MDIMDMDEPDSATGTEERREESKCVVDDAVHAIEHVPPASKHRCIARECDA